MGSSWLDLDLDQGRIDQLALDLSATEAEVKKAMWSTFSKMARWLRTRSERGLAKTVGVKTAIIRRRLKATLRKGEIGSIRVWYGLDPISLVDLGAKQTKVGVSAGKHKRPGAFLAEGRGGNRQVFKRVGRERLPIKKETLDIKDQADVFIEDEIIGTDEFNAQFWRTFEHELAWRTQQRK